MTKGSASTRARHPRHAAGQGLGQRAKPWRRSQLFHPTLYRPAIWTKPLTGNVPVSFDSLRVLIPLLQPGRVRGLAVTSAARSPLLLEQPAVAEVFSGYEVIVFNFIAVRRGTPAPIIGRLSRELAVCMREPRTTQRNAPLNVDSLGTRRMSWRRYFARNHLSGAAWSPVLAWS